MRTQKTWPKIVIVGVVFALLGGIAAALWVRHEQNVSAEEVQSAARIERVDGQVAVNNSLKDDTNDAWIEATSNMPIAAGDRIYTRDNSRAAVAFTGRNFARLDDGTALDVLSLSPRRTQLALRDGSALFDVGYLEPGDLFEVGTPYGAVDFNQPGLYEMGIGDNGNVWISVLSGLAQVVGLSGSGQISKGEMLTLLGQTAAQVALSRIDPSYAGGLVNDYYGYRYPDIYDGRYRDYNAYLNDPYYYDPYRRYNSYQYVNYQVPGLYDLDPYGDWVNVNNYGYGWRPRVDANWAPYQSGYWVNDYPYGLTWVSSEPWGYAPYHYGRWANVNGQWYWIPDSVNTQPSYAPALVAFLPLNDNGVGWVPLAPNDPYAPRYYDENWQPHYYTRADLRPRDLINLGVPGAISVVPWQDFDGYLDNRRIRHADWRSLGSVQPILEPLLDTPLRNAALRSAWGRGKIDIPPGIAKRLDNPVVIGSEVRGLPYRKDLAKRMRVQSVGDDARKKHLDVRDDRQVVRNEKSNGRGRDYSRQAQQEQRAQPEQRQEQKPRVENAQGERVGASRGQQVESQRRQVVMPDRGRGDGRAKKEAQPRVRYIGPPVPERQTVQPAGNARPRVEQRQPDVSRGNGNNRQGGRPQVQQAQPQVQRVQPQGQAQRAEKPQHKEGGGGGGGQPQKGGKGKGKP